MAGSAPSDKVKDKEYSNWLKVTLALYYMKSGLHTFMQSEVECLHQSLVQKIYGGKPVPLPSCAACHSCHVQRNKYSGVWTFPKQCTSYCHVWLYELLALHTNPKSEKIYWNNSDVASWPFKPWECAKVFMPRGQLPSNVGPDECDAQAMLTLLTSCKHFHHKLSPQGLGLTGTISTIRNKVMHDGEMKLSDTGRVTYIQQIIQFLEDPVCLKSIEDCKAAVGNVQKINNDSLDVSFNLDTEMACLRSAVNEFRLELGMQDKITLDTVDSWKEEYKQLREQIIKRCVDVENRMDTIERNVRSVKEQADIALQQQEMKHQEMEATVTHMSADLTTYRARLDTVEENVEYIYHRSATIERTIQSVKEQTDTALQQQKKKHEEMHANVTSHEVRLDAVEENMQSFSTQLQEFKTNTDTALQQQEKKHEELMHVSLTSHGVRLDTAEENVNIFSTELQLLKTNTDTALQQQEKKYQDVKTTVTHLSASVTSHELRLAAVEDNVQELKTNILTKGANNSGGKMKVAEEWISLYSTSETSVKRRPETDGLRQLKCQTEDKLDTVRRLGYIPTTQEQETKKLLDGKRSVVIKGNPGEGKTTAALHLIDNEIYRDRRVVVYCPRDWKTVDTDWVDVVVLEDIFGQFDLDHSRLQEWMMYLPTIQEHVDAGKLQVIITTRTDLLSKVFSKLGSIKLFFDDLSLTLSSEKLKNSEKMSILNKELLKHQRNMNENEKEKCISNFTGLIGFPQCCSLFAGDSNLFNKGPEFFKSPSELFSDNISKLEDTRFLSLAFLFCNDEILEDYLSLEAMPESIKHLLMEVASRLHISEEKTSLTLLRDIYDNFGGLYVAKSISDNFSLEFGVKKHCIMFSHPIVCEAVGQVLGERCIEIVVKYGNSEYLYQRTYTAEAKDRSSPNVFIPVSVYKLLAERMARDLAKQRLVKRVVKHSALRQHQFLIEFKDELLKGNKVKDFFINKLEFSFDQDLAEGECATFVQYILQSDNDVVTLMFSQFLEFLACTHNMNRLNCWQCEEKQNLLELSLYYHHFEIADKLIAMNANCTHISLCNAARHGDLRRVQMILKTLKRSKTFSPLCDKAKDALCRAYMSGNQNVIELFLKEGITLDSKHVLDVVRHGGDMNALMKVTEHLKFNNKWNPHLEKHWRCRDFSSPSQYGGKLKRHEVGTFSYSIALHIAYCNEKFHMADYLVENGVIVSMGILPHVLECSSQKAADRLIQSLKDSGTWDSNCWPASVTLAVAYATQKYDVNDLIELGLSLTMENLPSIISESKAALESAKKAIQHLKDTDNWDPKCYHASSALGIAYGKQKLDVCDLLIEEGVSLSMNYFRDVVCGFQASFEYVSKAIQHLIATDSWDPKCQDASMALKYACENQKYDLWDLLIQNGVSMTLKNDYFSICTFGTSYESIKKAVQHLKDTDNWDPECDVASGALEDAYCQKKYDVCDLLVQEGVSPTMKNLASIIMKYDASFELAKKAIKHLKYTGNWDPMCDDAFVALDNAYRKKAYDVCALLAENGISVRMNHLPCAIMTTKTFEFVRKIIQNLKDTDDWDPKCKDASIALMMSYGKESYDVCDLLIQEGVSLTIHNLSNIVYDFEASFKSVKKAIQHLKDTGSWDPACASLALEYAYIKQAYDVCDLLVEEKVSLTMYNLYDSCRLQISAQSAQKALQNLTNTNNWYPKCDYASMALSEAYCAHNYDVCDLLIQEGVSLTMRSFCDVVCRINTFEGADKALKNLKDKKEWDPKCDAASTCLEKSYWCHKRYVCDLLIQEGVPLTMMHLLNVMRPLKTFESVKKTIQMLKDTGKWDPKCHVASEALRTALDGQKYDVCDLLIQEGISLTMKNLPGLCGFPASFEFARKAIQYLKDTKEWDPICDHASTALTDAFKEQAYDVCDLLLEHGVPLTMSFLPQLCRSEASFRFVRKVIQHLKDTGNWDPKSDDTSEALKYAYNAQAYDVCDLLVQKVSPTMHNFPHLCRVQASFQPVRKAIEDLKDTDNWDPKCDDASKALAIAYFAQAYDVCDLLLDQGVSLTMKNLPSLCCFSKIKSQKKVIKHLKDTDNWDPECDDASEALENAYAAQAYDLCDLLLEQGVALTMKNFKNLCWPCKYPPVSDQSLRKVIKHLKDTDNWDPKCDDASEAFEYAYNAREYDVHDLHLEQEVSLALKNLPYLCKKQSSYCFVKKLIKNLKDAENWDPKCEYATKALENACISNVYGVFGLLLEHGVSLTMKNLPFLCRYQPSNRLVKKAIQHLKVSGNWDPECDDAYKALENAYIACAYDVFDLLLKQGVSLTMKTLSNLLCRYQLLHRLVKKAIQHLKVNGNWDPECDDAYKALENACNAHAYDVCDLLLKQGVSLTMKTLPYLCGYKSSYHFVEKVIKNLKDTDNWDPKCEYATKALEYVYIQQRHDIYYMLCQEGVAPKV